MSLAPVFLSPALPSELLTYIISKCAYPTTLIVCSTRTDFLASLTNDVLHQIQPEDPEEKRGEPEDLEEGGPPSTIIVQNTPGAHLLAAPLFQVAVAKHIRIVFVPTVSHLRVFLSLFGVTRTNVTAPPQLPHAQVRDTQNTPLLFVFGFLDLHRDTSEWSAQGLSNTAAALVDAAREARLRAVILEPTRHGGERNSLESVVEESVPVLSSSARRAAADLEEGGWTGRTVPVRRVLGRWFRFREGDWAKPV